MPSKKTNRTKAKTFLLKNGSVSQTIAKNTFWLSFSEIIGRLLRIAIIIYAARILGTAGWGMFSYLTSLAAVFTIFSDVGISSVLIREISKNPESRNAYFSTSFVLKLFLTAVSFLVIIFVTPLFTGIELTKSLIIFIGFLFIFDSLRRFGTSLFRAEEKMELEALTNIITQAVILVGGFIALFVFKTPESLAGAYAIGAGVGLIITSFILKDDVKKLFTHFDKEILKSIFKDAWPFSLAAIFGVLLVNTDAVMIGWFGDATDVGLYAAAQKPIALLYILPTLIVGGFFPALARFTKNKEKFREVLERGLAFTILISFPIAVGIMLTADQIIEFVYGSAFALSAAPLRVLSLTIFTAFPIGIIIHAIFAHNKQKEIVPFWIAGVIFNILLNIYLIPRQGIVGAAWASLLSQIVINSLIWMKLKKIVPFSITKKLPSSLLATGMMAVSIILVRQLDAPLFIVIPIAGFTYFGSLMFSGENPFQSIKEARGIK